MQEPLQPEGTPITTYRITVFRLKHILNEQTQYLHLIGKQQDTVWWDIKINI